MKNSQVLKKGAMSAMYMVLAAIIVAGAIAWFATRQGTVAPTTDNNDMMKQSEESDDQEEREDDTKEKDDDKMDAVMEQKARKIVVKGSPFKFEPNEIRVKKGEKVEIEFENEKGTHDLVIDEFNVRTDIIEAGDDDSIDFTADQVGTFEYYCSVGNHRAQGMVGNLIVE